MLAPVIIAVDVDAAAGVVADQAGGSRGIDVPHRAVVAADQPADGFLAGHGARGEAGADAALGIEAHQAAHVGAGALHVAAGEAVLHQRVRVHADESADVVRPGHDAGGTAVQDLARRAEADEPADALAGA